MLIPLASLASASLTVQNVTAMDVPDDYKIGGFAPGCQAYYNSKLYRFRGDRKNGPKRADA